MRRWRWGAPRWPTRCLAASMSCARAVADTMPRKLPRPGAWGTLRRRTLSRRTFADCSRDDEAPLLRRRRLRRRGVPRGSLEPLGVGRPHDHLHERLRPHTQRTVACLRRRVLASRIRWRAVPAAHDRELRRGLAAWGRGVVSRSQSAVACRDERPGYPVGATLERRSRSAGRRPDL